MMPRPPLTLVPEADRASMNGQHQPDRHKDNTDLQAEHLLLDRLN